MSFKDLFLEDSYDSNKNNLLQDFYLPVLKQAKNYKRIAGFFSSTSLSIAAEGYSHIIKRGGNIKLVVSPRLSKEDIDVIEKSIVKVEDKISEKMLFELDHIESDLQKKRLEAFAYLLSKGFIEIKIAVIKDPRGKLLTDEEIEKDRMLHMKVGILEDDDGNIITFSGSLNETATAWTKNGEEFKVFQDWKDGIEGYIKSDIEKFNRFWEPQENAFSNIKIDIYDLPQAVSKKILEKRPDNFEKIEQEIIDYQKEQSDFGVSFNPFFYQKDALNIWKKNHKAIFEMATGTGKTKTAELCIAQFFREHKKSTVIFIVCPQNTLAKQWLDDIAKSGLDWKNNVIADSTNSNWRKELTIKLLDLNADHYGKKERLFVYTTFDTFCSFDFKKIVLENKYNSKYFIIGDEVHGLGAQERSTGLLDIYDYRLGLSATPDRWYDENGTRKIINFFGTDRFCFSIQNALNTVNPLTGHTYLTPYKYNPLFVNLEIDEIENYLELTKSIIKKIGKAQSDEEARELLQLLTFIRADIHKSAKNKIIALQQILDKLSNNISNTIIFSSPNQIDEVISILNKRRIFSHKFTFEEGKKAEKKYNNISEREQIVNRFKSGDYKVLVAIKCLDEGIDIPSADTGIILASTTNPREYIQRIGRVIRYQEGKQVANIYDIIVEPSYSGLPDELRKIEKSIFGKEIIRIKDIAENAINRTDIIKTIYEKL